MKTKALRFYAKAMQVMVSSCIRAWGFLTEYLSHSEGHSIILREWND